MTETSEVTVAATIRWLHDEGLVRLAGVGGRIPNPIAAYTIDVATGSVGVHPATGVGVGSDVITLAADDLPYPSGTPKRLVIVGVTSTDSVLVVDLAITHAIAINADRPETAARAWATQLLLNPEVTITTNSADIAVAASPRCRHHFIPGGGATVLNVDDQRPPVTTVTLNATVEGPDHLDIAPDGSGEMYLGARFWQLRQVLSIDDAVWTVLSARLEDSDD
ncbi:hypothetical protein OG874_22460 [Nocardia sp. NBC_00565]|uniref:hypothetical protein n=1 Tax=Nocardia sp. NBC_00565 TaxID=2975993 RepID=UPI002E8080E8|nr:hypothetical protein [Nocardia sp. NBC_00565]WUC07682.1 hypothetical protein OG874_22460 [Nocardia sp. NBC_00565]